MTDTAQRAPVLRIAYQVVLGTASGFSLGWFAWVIVSRQVADPVFWPFAVGGVAIGLAVVWRASSSPVGRSWMHALWIPVAAFAVLMTAIVIALRSWGS